MEMPAGLKDPAFGLVGAPVRLLALFAAIKRPLSKLSIAVTWGAETPGATVYRFFGAARAAIASRLGCVRLGVLHDGERVRFCW